MNIFSYKSQGAAELSSDAEEKPSPCGQGTFWNVGLDSNLNSWDVGLDLGRLMVFGARGNHCVSK